MGEDKARVAIAGRSMIDRTLDVLRELAAPIVLATGPSDRYADLGFERVRDGHGTTGPVAGLLAAIEHRAAERYLLVACDMPRLDARLLKALVQRSETEALDVCFFESERGREPLCAVYSRNVQSSLQAAQAHGKRRVIAFLDEPEAESLRVGVLRADELGGGLRDLDCARNLNTPEELREERRAWEGGGA